MEYYQVIKGGLGAWYLPLGYLSYSVHIIPFIYQKGFLIRQKQIIENVNTITQILESAYS